MHALAAADLMEITICLAVERQEYSEGVERKDVHCCP